MRHPNRPLDLSSIEMHSVRDRHARLSADDLAAVPNPAAPASELMASLPKTGPAATLREAIGAVREAVGRGRPITALIGAPVLAEGYSPIVAHLIEQGILNAVCLDGAAALFDFELACYGQTDEDPASPHYGASREVGETFNQIINDGVSRGFGLGEYLGRALLERSPRFLDLSILAHAAAKQILVTVHPQFGAEPIHRHPAADGANLGKGAQRDFLLLAGHLGGSADGGLALDLWSGGMGGVFGQAQKAAAQAASGSPAGWRCIGFEQHRDSNPLATQNPDMIRIQGGPMLLSLLSTGIFSQ